MERPMSSLQHATFSPSEETAFVALSKHPNLYQIISHSMAPSISGSYTHDIKKALVCLLLGGSRKRLPDGVNLRGDINVLLLGDPSTAKSQFLKFAAQVAPIGIYTSGKGSSAAGLTASVVKDKAGEFYLEGGAMVLADGGIVCIDEFDKMRPQDRVAIHEAMEQQTISIAKAGITTVLNSRSSVLAAANPVYGRYDDLKSASEQIDLMTTILSRFDLIFLVRDVREEARDRMICEHVMGVHMGHSTTTTNEERVSDQGDNDDEAIAESVLRVAETGQGELSTAALKKYIQFCKARCSPRLDEASGEELVSNYVRIRDEVRKRNLEASAKETVCVRAHCIMNTRSHGFCGRPRPGQVETRKPPFPLQSVSWKPWCASPSRSPRCVSTHRCSCKTFRKPSVSFPSPPWQPMPWTMMMASLSIRIKFNLQKPSCQPVFTWGPW
jgi:DNA replication licensing factor MCM5